MQAGMGEMIGGDLGLAPRRPRRTEGRADRCVERLATRAQQALVGRLLHQCVLEAVAALDEVAAREREPGLDELGERRVEFGLADAGDRGEQRARELAADDGRHLRHVLDPPKPVEPRHQRILQGRRHRLAAQPASSTALVSSST